jgi:hypothetical protein
MDSYQPHVLKNLENKFAGSITDFFGGTQVSDWKSSACLWGTFDIVILHGAIFV